MEKKLFKLENNKKHGKMHYFQGKYSTVNVTATDFKGNMCK